MDAFNFGEGEELRAELFSKEKLFSGAFDNVPAYLYIKDRQRRYVYANRPTLRLFGCSAEELAGSGDERFFPPATVARLKEVDERVLKRGESTREEIEVVDGDGAKTVYWEIKNPIHGGSGAIIGLCGISCDITERKLAELEKERLLLELGRKATEMEAILAAQNDVILSYDLGMYVRQVNPSFIGMYGFDPVGLHLTEIIRRVSCRTLDGKPVVLEEGPTPRALQGERVKSAFYRVTRVDGSTGIVESSSMPMRVDGHVAGAVTVWHDITDRHHAEAALHKSQALFHNYFELGQIGMAIISADRRWLKVNARLCEMLGYEKEDLYAATWTAVTHQDDVEAELAQFGRLTAGEIEGYDLDKRLVRKNGTAVEVHLTVSCQRKDDRSVDYLMASLLDITARKRLEREIRQMGAYNRSLIEASPDPLVTIGPDGKIMDVNTATEIITGHRREKLVGTDFSNYFTDREKAQEGCRLVFRHGKVVDYPLDFLHPGGKVTPVLYNASVYRDEEGRVLGVFAAARDITARKKAEEELVAAKERAEEATKVKDKFVSLVAHDLRGPLGGMKTMLQLLEDASLGMQERATLLKNAQEANAGMLTLIEDLLDVSRVKSGKMKPSPKFFSAHHFAAKALEEFKYAAGRKNVALVNEVPKRARLYADEGLLYEVLHNLVSNALKFSQSGAAIRLFVPEGGQPAIAVADEGIGIAPGRLKHLFEYETKTSTTGTGGEHGTGLGLPLSRDIVEAHGGTLTAESAVGKGSTFVIRLPEVKPRILVVDDDEVAHQLLVMQLRELEPEIIEARNGWEAFNLARSKTPHLMIIDLMMPEMSGYELIAHLKDDLNTASIPIIVATADPSAEARNRCFRLGVQDFLQKPLIDQDMATRARMLLGLP